MEGSDRWWSGAVLGGGSGLRWKGSIAGGRERSLMATAPPVGQAPARRRSFIATTVRDESQVTPQGRHR